MSFILVFRVIFLGDFDKGREQRCTKHLVLSSPKICGGEGKTSKGKDNVRKQLLLPNKAFVELQNFGFPNHSTNK